MKTRFLCPLKYVFALGRALVQIVDEEHLMKPLNLALHPLIPPFLAALSCHPRVIFQEMYISTLSGYLYFCWDVYFLQELMYFQMTDRSLCFRREGLVHSGFWRKMLLSCGKDFESISHNFGRSRTLYMKKILPLWGNVVLQLQNTPCTSYLFKP